MDIVYFDLETQRTSGDVGGWSNKHAMGMSVGVTYSTRDARYEIFGETQADALVSRLQRADLVVGFNLLNFDYDVLMAYTILDLRAALPTLDLLVDIEKSAGRRLALEAVATATLGVGKTAESLDAVRWWREGRMLDIARYCCFDVKVTRMVHEHGLRHGEVFYVDRFGQRQRVATRWTA